MDRRQFLLAAGSLPFMRAAAQEPAVFTADVKVVNVLATVRTKSGQMVHDLQQDDFLLAEDGRPQTIRYFSRDSDLPLTLGLLIDTSISQRRVLEAERGACFRFLDQVLREAKDKVFIMQFDMAVQLRQPLTSSRRQLEETLPFVDTPTFRELRNQSGGGTLLYDAVIAAANDVMSRQRDRKAVIVLSDGVDTGSEATLAAAIDAAARADTIVYSILFADPGAYAGPLFGTTGRKALTRLALETGGEFFEVSKKQPIQQIFDAIERQLRSQYSIGYVSDLPVKVSEFRKIQLTTKQKTLGVQARTKYWAKR